MYKALEPVAPGMYSIAAAFGNVHGVYSPGNVKLTPKILATPQKFVKAEEGSRRTSPATSSSTAAPAPPRGHPRGDRLRCHQDEHRHRHAVELLGRRQGLRRGQVRLPPGPDRQPRRPEKPNKKYYDPRMWLREAETYTVNRLLGAYEDLNAMDALSK